MANIVSFDNTEIMEGLAQQWKNRQFCDAKLKVEGKVIMAHKCVLSAASEYFRSMFRGNFKESKKGEVEIKGITHVAMETIMNAIYTKKYILHDSDVVEVLSAADFLQINKIVKECEKHMTNFLELKNCFEYLKLSEKFRLKDLQEVAHDFIMTNFHAVSNEKGFLDITKELLYSYLANEKLQVKQEIDLFRAVKCWIEHDKERLKFAAEMMGAISLASIPPESITGVVRKVPFVRDNEKCMDLVFEALNYHGKLYSQPLYKGTINKPRGRPSLFFIQGADTSSDVSFSNGKTQIGHISMKDLSRPSNTVKGELSIPFTCKSVSLVTHGNFLFLFAVDNRSFTPVTMRFDGNTETWINLAPIPRSAAIGSSTVRLGDFIIVAGGYLVQKESEIPQVWPKSCISDVYKYDIRHDSWSKCKDHPVNFACAGACEFRGEMYVGGGRSNESPQMKLFYAFNIQCDKWVKKENLPFYSERLNLAVIDKYSIIGFGGSHESVFSYTPDIKWSRNWFVDRRRTFKYLCYSFVVHENEVIIITGDEKNPNQITKLYFEDSEEITRLLVEEWPGGRLCADHDKIAACAVLTLR